MEFWGRVEEALVSRWPSLTILISSPLRFFVPRGLSFLLTLAFRVIFPDGDGTTDAPFHSATVAMDFGGGGMGQM